MYRTEHPARPENNNLLRDALFCFLLFFFFFDIPLPLVRSSAVFCVAPLFLLYCLSDIFRQQARTFFASHYCRRWIVSYLLIALYALIVIVFRDTYDTTIFKTYANNIFSFVTAALIGALTFAHYKTERDILRLITAVFVIQSLLEMISFTFPGVKDLFNSLHDNNAYVSDKLDEMNSVKGFAFAGSTFFSLSAQFAVFFMLFIRAVKMKYFTMRWSVVLFVILFVGGSLTGRTFYAGVVVGFIYLFLGKGGFATQIKFCLYSVLLSALLLLLLAVLNAAMFDKMQSFSRYAFELVYNYFSGEGLQSTSTTGLNSMYFPVSDETFFLGDGYYAARTGGGYYKGSDAGYMRNILFFGIGGFLLLLNAQIRLLFHRNLRDFKSILSFVLILILILHYKGETLSFLVSVQRLLCVYVAFLALLPPLAASDKPDKKGRKSLHPIRLQ